MATLLDVSSLVMAKDASLHAVPCKISHVGDATVDKFFCTSVRSEKEEKKPEDSKSNTASFRGRPLNGCNIEVPSGYTGIVMKENRKPFNEDDDRNFKISHKFQSMTYWNLDKTPSANDKFQQALEWLDISKNIHSQDVNDAEINSQYSNSGEK